MKRTILSLFLGLSLASTASADDLHTVYKMAVENDPIINRAEAQRDAAFAGIDISRASLLPQISGTVSYSDSTREFWQQQSETLIFSGESDTTSVSYGLTLNMSLYDHSNWLNLDRAELQAQQSDASLGAELQNLMARTVNAYLAVLREQDSVEFVKAELAAIERQLEQTKQRFEVGLTAITDVHEAQANFDNTVARQIRAENLLELRLEELREITGKYHASIHVLDTDKFTAVPPQPELVTDWLSLAEDSNLSLLAQRFARDIAKEDIDIATSGHYPTLGLRGSFDSNDDDGTTNFDGATEDTESDPPRLNRTSIALQLSVPIYSGGGTTAQTDRARANYVVASENLESTYRQTVRLVRSSFNDVRAAISTIRALEQSVISAESALNATEAGFDVGTRTIVDVLNSTRNLFDARRNLADARYNFITAIVGLKQSAGTLSEDDIIAINKSLSPAPAPQS